MLCMNQLVMKNSFIMNNSGFGILFLSLQKELTQHMFIIL